MRALAGLRPDTAMQVVVHPGLAELYLGNVRIPGRFEPHRVSGWCRRAMDVPQTDAVDLAGHLGLPAIEGWPRGGPVYLMRLRAGHPWLYTLGSTHSPEYLLKLIEIPQGAELLRVETAGGVTRIGRYGDRRTGWTPCHGAGYGPTAWQQPAALARGVRRGLVATHRGRDFDADFAAEPGAVLLQSRPDENGAPPLEVLELQLESFGYLRQRVAWQGAAFEVLEVTGQTAVLHYLGSDRAVASELGLMEVSYRVWRVVIPRGELGSVEAEFTPLRT
ncbi:hypothetical protein D5S17_24580 [Pseudonocardiaceae bacterium YIM PH 21723]|nr:hypothetical protein D5S17_24580 [Pseudonocardiaceae bacterium YIM PH 21723]